MMITGEITHNFANYVLQMQIHQSRKDIMENKTDMQQSIDRLYELCSKYAFAVQEDFRQIFKIW
jgi:hypothetical protein